MISTMISRTTPVSRASFHILPVLLMGLLAIGCNDRILPADGSANIWGGRTILFNQDQSEDIHTMSLDAETFDQPRIAKGFLLCPAMKGRFIYSATDISGTRKTIYLHDGTSSTPLVTDQPGEYMDDIAAISPDGSRVVYVTTDSNSGDVYLNMIRIDGGGSGPVRLGWYFGTITGLIFSPDGRHVGITAGEYLQPEVLYIFDLDGDSVVMTLDDREADISATIPLLGTMSIYWFQWMPDGKRIMYQDYDAVSRRWIMIAPIDGSYPRTVAEGNYTFPTPSPDGKRIAAIRDDNQLWVMNADGSGERRLIFDTMGGASFLIAPQWSADGSKILLYKMVFGTQFSSVVEVVDVATGRRKALVTNILPASWLEG